MVVDIVQRLRDAGQLVRGKPTDTEIADIFLDAKDAPLKKSQIMDTLEYGRAVHAEMSALAAALRLGLSVKHANFYCTTFPCHNCAKHIVAAGIEHVIYLEPYAKSYAGDLYPDAIRVDSGRDSEEKVSFRQFIGITPLRYRSLFAKERLKDEKGNVRQWSPSTAQPVIDSLDQGHPAREAIFQKHVNDTIVTEGRHHLGQS